MQTSDPASTGAAQTKTPGLQAATVSRDLEEKGVTPKEAPVIGPNIGNHPPTSKEPKPVVEDDAESDDSDLDLRPPTPPRYVDLMVFLDVHTLTLVTVVNHEGLYTDQ